MTNGLVRRASTIISGATAQAMASADTWPMRLGTNSPTTIDTYVTTTTTRMVEVMELASGDMPTLCSQMAKGPASTASPKIPLSRPIEVMPICTAERNWVGSSASFNAILAPRLPRPASASRRDFLAVTIAISDMANTPLRRIRPIRTKTSIDQNVPLAVERARMGRVILLQYVFTASKSAAAPGLPKGERHIEQDQWQEAIDNAFLESGQIRLGQSDSNQVPDVGDVKHQK